MAAVRSVRARPGDLLFHHPAADEAQAAEGAGVPRQPEGRRPGHHHRRHLRPGHAARRAERAAADRRQGPDRSAKAAIGGYQGQPPVVEPPRIRRVDSHDEPSLEARHDSRRLRRLLRRSASIRSSRRATASPSPGWLMDKQLKLGLDLKGGVHLVLRVQTDDALRLETEHGDGAAARGADDARASPSPTSRRPIRRSSGRRRAAGAGRGVPARRPTRCRRTSIAARGVNGTYTFTMKPNIAGEPARRSGRAGAPDDRAPRQRAGRRPSRASRSRAQRRSDPRAAARRHRRRAREGDHPVDRACSS